MKSATIGDSSFLSCCVALLLLSISSWAQTATAPKIYGTWHTYPLGNPSTDPVRHEFRHNSATNSDEMIVTRACAAENRVVVAKAVSPIEITQDTIKVLKTVSDTEPIQGTSSCQADIHAGTLGYSFSDDGEHLILTDPGGNPDILELTPDTNTGEEQVPQRLYGTWLLPPVNGKEMRVQVRWVFYTTAEHQDRVRQIAVCSKGNDSLVTQVDSDINVAGDKIRILQSGSRQQQAGDFICKASLVATTWRYSISSTGLFLTLYTEGAKPLTLTREPKAGLN
jgi:hypothetical protein